MEMIDTYQESAVSYKTARFLKLMVLLIIIVALNVGGTWLSHLIDFQLFPRHEPMLHAIVVDGDSLHAGNRNRSSIDDASRKQRGHTGLSLYTGGAFRQFCNREKNSLSFY